METSCENDLLFLRKYDAIPVMYHILIKVINNLSSDLEKFNMLTVAHREDDDDDDLIKVTSLTNAILRCSKTCKNMFTPQKLESKVHRCNIRVRSVQRCLDPAFD